MPEQDPTSRDPREKRKPKDSEFYQIPPDLKKEFEVLMAGRISSEPAVEGYARSVRSRRRLATASFLFGLLGCVLVGVGPLLAIILGTIALRSGKREEGVKGGFDPAKWGILFGVLMLLVNAVVIYLFLR